MKPSLSLDYLPFLASLLPVHTQMGQQPDNLCGPYWVALLLNAYGGWSVSPVEVAIAAATVVPSRGDPADWLPAGAKSRLDPDYQRIPTDPDVDKSGTSMAGLMRATEVLSQGRFCLLPLQTTDWESGLNTVWELCQTDEAIVPLVNVHTRYFWGSALSLAEAIAHLAGQPITPPPPDWRVGHFALLAGRMQGSARFLYAVLDTYPHFGWSGLHLQPPTALAQGLARPDLATEGGIALFLPQGARSRVAQQLIESGGHISPWDNGSPG